ncbi:Peptidoglycan-binding domain 1 protein [Alkaliphilus metalliredigens QYMF]|uniref:Peptidoglycan-binding domain 1 protein n=1 Tax=Alkaliphilus metalliredigens (strain QYMF) TaxID=293826 RepID=A6TKQ0_ALKMQ|nr:LysM peptidoglycan-binding domain-containing protein [Alkaliphilus metalliredigens]ABR46768.1 Peptidoglycan-binding domain 1 protein [Alkaliphilus metalliredigens QYMF]
MYYSQAPCPTGTISYTIQSGDTFYAIARAYNISLDVLLAANPGVNPDRLMVGQRICIPISTPPSTGCPVGTVPYTIRAGDTFYSIATTNNIPLDALLTANPGVNPDRLMVGQVICVPRNTPPPTTACPTLRVGSRGPDVERLQRLLRDNGYDPGPIDGIFGTRTQLAVIAFQRDLNIVADGIVGPRTWTGLGVDCTAPPVPPTPPSPTCPTGTTPHTIVAGDTFYNLAIQYNTTVDAIRRANPNVNPDNLQVGQRICIPVTTPPSPTCPTGTAPHTIELRDSFYNLAIQYNTTVEAIRRANPNVDPQNLIIGQIICIPLP